MLKKKTASLPHLDANENIFFARQLNYIKAKIYQTKYPQFKARDVIPVSFEVNPGAETITYTFYDAVGIAKLIASYADDLPRADVKGTQTTSPVRGLGASYGYSIQEIRAAAMANADLKGAKANAAKQAMAYKENQLALLGDTVSGVPGLLTNVNIPQIAFANDGTGASTAFTTKTGTQIVRDLNSVVNSVITTTFGVEVPDTLLLPLSTWSYLRSNPFSIYSDMTILDFFLEQNDSIQNVDWLNELETAGPGGTKAVLAYPRNPDYVTLEIPQDFEQFDPQAENLEFLVPCHQRIGGTIITRPLAFAMGYGA